MGGGCGMVAILVRDLQQVYKTFSHILQKGHCILPPEITCVYLSTLLFFFVCIAVRQLAGRIV